jgi:RNA polymerase sigma-70 factor, ECF subfamily
MDERPDGLLVGEARRGDREAFAELVRRHERRVYGLVFRMVRDHSDADDLAQEVFLTAFKSIAAFRQGASFSTWVYRIAVNLSLTFLKRKRREKGRAEFREDLVVGGTERGLSASPEDRSTMNELKSRIDEAVDALPGHFRASFLLVAAEGLSHAEAAEVLGCSENTVSWRMHKARKLLRARLSPFLGEVRP